MIPSVIHNYFIRIDLNPALGWEILETALENPCADLQDTNHLRRLLAQSVSTYIDMAWDDEDRQPDTYSSLFTHYVEPLLNSKLYLTLDEQRMILGTAAWYEPDIYSGRVRTLVRRKVLPPSEA